MKIYTGTGDDGRTKLFGGKIVDKDDLRVEVYGTIDELNSWLGLVLTYSLAKHISENLFKIQNDLFPNRSLQERQTNFSEFYNEYGEELISNLIDNLDPLESNFKILTFGKE